MMSPTTTTAETPCCQANIAAMNRTLDEMAKAVVEPDWPVLDQAGYEALPTDPPDEGGYFRAARTAWVTGCCCTGSQVCSTSCTVACGV